ncbi:MAG: hypothetical protein ACLFM1_07235 [Bacteroidales bacterium]
MLRYRLILILVVCFALQSDLLGQWDEDIFRPGEEEYDTGAVIFGIDNFNHFANLEYYNPMANSYTLAGYHIEPEITYQVSGKISISGGMYLMNLLGREKPWMLRPVYTLQYMPLDNLRLRFGNLKSGLEHRLVEQVYSYRQAYEQFNEEGIQATYRDENLFFDVWLDWRYLSLPNDNQPERIFGGYSIDYSQNIDQISEVSLFTQMSAWHNGGQNLNVERKLQTLLNFVGGASYTARLSDTKSLGGKAYFIHYENVVSQDILPFNRGYGAATEMQAAWRFVQVKAAYWYADRFYAPLGNPLYSGVSEKYANYFQKYRHVLSAHAKIENSYDNGISLGFRTGIYQGLDLNRSDFYITLLMRFNRDFFIKGE